MYSNTALHHNLKLLKIIPDSQLDDCLKEAETRQLDLHQVLLSHDLLSDENIGKIKADLYNLRYVRISEISLDKSIAKYIPQEFAKKYHCLVIAKTEPGMFTVAAAHPEDPMLVARLQTRFGTQYQLVYATDRDLRSALKVYAEDPQSTFDQLLKGGIKTAQKQPNEPPIISIVDTIIRFAYDRSASDIHIEPSESDSLVRFRIDGVMHDIVSLPIDIHPRLVTRIKVMASLKTDEANAPQDGKLNLTIDDDRLDIRVSLVPIVHGESIVLRLLSAKSRQFSLLDLGLSESAAAKLDAARKKPHGMLLATGPTGSGKTTTLYAILKLLNSRGVNIMTIEDPVEYEIQGTNQIQVNKATDLTFADGLKSIVRQDPDIILVGEIRDSETAGIAVNSAMTGHLVLSTLHTNDAATSLPRLIDMGIEPFLIASTINMIIAQRLVRKICVQCRVSEEVEVASLDSVLSETVRQKYFASEKTRLYHGTGCPACQNTGYNGRIGIFELMEITEDIKDAIVAKKDAGEIQKLAIQAGMNTLFDDGIHKVKGGMTTLEEILRVTKE